MALPESIVSDGKLTTPAIVALALLAFLPVALIAYFLWARCQNRNGNNNNREGDEYQQKGDDAYMMSEAGMGSTAHLTAHGQMPAGVYGGGQYPGGGRRGRWQQEYAQQQGHWPQ
jgi:hypothetical protein